MGLFKRIVRRAASRAESKAESTIQRKADELGKKAIEKIKEVKLDVKGKLTTDFEDFKAKWERDSRQPEKSILYFLIAAHNADADKDLGESMATLTLPTPYLSEDTKSPSGFKIDPKGDGAPIWEMWSDPITVKSYLGGEAEDDYKLDDDKVVLRVIGKATKGREGAIVITSADGDTEVTCSLKRNKQGQWKIFTMESADVGKIEEGDF